MASQEARVDYRNRDDMHDLAECLLKVPSDWRPAIAAFIVDHDLMRPQWWIRTLLWIVRKRHGHTAAVWARLEQKTPGVAVELICATADHIRFGKDRTTKDAFGGFNQAEVDFLSEALSNVDAAIRNLKDRS